ncbi:MAG: winged helix-turn-helix transcriptional regulator [Deltaproteobacteria bacterium]|jgi:ArsR family transcriptional regulator|nr:winged helix-turn-helix transcriptional regulator [Deltaproteobacteria bacterium]
MSEDFCQVNCQVNIIHQKQVMQATENMPSDHLISEAADLFSLLGDNSRLRILQALNTTELCVCDLAAILNTSSSAVSHQLRLMRTKGLVRYRKEGKIAYYSLADRYVQDLLSNTFEHLKNG